MNRNKCKKPKKPKHCIHRDGKNLGFIMLVFSIVTICAFFLPIRAWILLLGLVLLYCGIRLYCNK